MTWRRSAEPSSPCGVPTAMNTTSDRANRFGKFRGEDQPAFGFVALDQLFEAGFVDRDLAAAQHRDLGCVLVYTRHLVTRLGHAGAEHEPDIPRPHDRDLHSPSKTDSVSSGYNAVNTLNQKDLPCLWYSVAPCGFSSITGQRCASGRASGSSCTSWFGRSPIRLLATARTGSPSSRAPGRTGRRRLWHPRCRQYASST